MGMKMIRGNINGQVETDTDSDGDCNRFSDDRDFCRDEEMLEELIVDGLKSGVDDEAFESSNTEQPRSSQHPTSNDDCNDDSQQQESVADEQFSQQQPTRMDPWSQQSGLETEFEHQQQPETNEEQPIHLGTGNQQSWRKKQVRRRRNISTAYSEEATPHLADVHALEKDTVVTELHSDAGSSDEENNDD